MGCHVPSKIAKPTLAQRVLRSTIIRGLEPGLHINDVSEWQGNINWGAYNRPAVVVRVHSGYSPDTHFYANRNGARSRCQVRGFYHYMAPGRDVTWQANAFCDLVGGLLPGEFVVLDFEDPGWGGDGRNAALSWFATVRSRLGTSPSQEVFYTYWPYLVSHFGGGLGWLGGRPFWGAGYSVGAPSWRGSALLWQHTDGIYGDTQCEPGPGIGNCDCSVYGGTIAGLAAAIGGAAPPPPAPPRHLEDHDMYRLLAPGDPPVPMPLPVFAHGAAILTSDGGGINPTGGVPVRAAIRNENGAWVPLLGPKPDDPRLGPDPFVSWFPGGDRWIGLDGSGGLLVVENLSDARKTALGMAADGSFPAGNDLGLTVTWT